MTSSGIYRTWNEVIGYYSVGLAVAGTVGNVIAAGICMRKSLRKVPTFVFYAVMCITNAFSLYSWNLNAYFITFYGFHLQDFGLWHCRISQFVQMSFAQASSVLLVALVLERYLSVKIRAWRTSLFNAKRAALAAMAIVLVFVLVNMHMLWSLEFNLAENKTRSGVCVNQEIFKTMRSIHTYVYSIVPFALILTMDCLMLCEVIRSSRMKKSSSRNRSISISVTAFSVAFLILTAPHAILGGYFLVLMRSSELHLAINYTCTVVAYTFHGSNLLILLLSNTRFRLEFKTFLAEIKLLRKTNAQHTSVKTR